ncbi:hypothetical protein D3C87_1229250 [compost metagenome]
MSQGLKTQEVEFDQSDFLCMLHIVLNDLLSVCTLVQRRMLNKLSIGDNNAGSMDTSMANHTFHTLSQIQKCRHRWIHLHHLAHARLHFKSVFKRDAKFFWN